MPKAILMLATLFYLLAPVHAESKSPEQKSISVLFIGNSYTYYNNLPKLFQQMANANNRKVEVKKVAPGGRNFQKHIKEGKAVKAIHEKNWDVVILQNQSFEPVENPQNMLKYGSELANEVDKIGARKIFYLTMAYCGAPKWIKKLPKETQTEVIKKIPKMYPQIEAAYRQLAKQTNSEISPAGKAWQICHEKLPDLRLHTADNSHPNATGSYLTALVMYATVFGEKAENLNVAPFSVEKEKNNPKLTSTRKILEEAAWSAYQEFKK